MPKILNLDDDLLNKLYLEGKTIRALSKQFDCGFNTIARRIRAKRPIVERKDSYNWDHSYEMEIRRLEQLPEPDKAIILEFLEDHVRNLNFLESCWLPGFLRSQIMQRMLPVGWLFVDRTEPIAGQIRVSE